MYILYIIGKVNIFLLKQVYILQFSCVSQNLWALNLKKKGGGDSQLEFNYNEIYNLLKCLSK